MSKRLYLVDYYGRRTRAPWWQQIMFRLGVIGGRA